MKFELDRQTINDLELFRGKDSGNCVFNLFNHTKTKGGENYLLRLMENPLTDMERLAERTEVFKFITDKGLDLNINSGQLDLIEHYLKLNIPTLKNNFIDAFYQNLSYRLKPGNNYYLISTGIKHLKELFSYLRLVLTPLLQQDLPRLLNELVKSLMEFIDLNDFNELTNTNDVIHFTSISKFDCLFRKKYRDQTQDFMKSIYRLDAYISVGKAAGFYKLGFPEFINSSHPYISISSLFHPMLPDAVPYKVEVAVSKNVYFLTGPNMAGKSTFLKSFAIALYLAHLGFPVPALNMRTSVYHGIITTINIADDINRGYSHFYSEVKRVKEVALKLKEKNRIFVIFDELFRGTNVKDAFDASSAIIESFAKIKTSTFCISTHITEIADRLKNDPGIEFKCFNAELINGKPVYDYSLRNGVSHERMGMHILQNENIMEILNTLTGK